MNISTLKMTNQVDEHFNFKDDKSRRKFMEDMKTSDVLHKCFLDSNMFEKQCSNFFNRLKKKFHKSFKKVKLKKRHCNSEYGDPGIQKIISKKKKLEQEICSKNVTPVQLERIKNEINECENLIANKIGDKNRSKVQDYINESKKENGSLSYLNVWKLKNKLMVKNTSQPTAKKDKEANLITLYKGLKELYTETYITRLTKEIFHPKHQEIFRMKQELWSQRLKSLIKKKTPNWNVNDVIKAVKKLKNNKSRDPFGVINETLKDCAEMNDLMFALQKLVNGIKEEKHKYMTYATVTSLHKNKGSKSDLENDRGIFILTTVKKVLEKLLYQDIYDDIEENMSNSNIGARKGQNVRNHVFVVNGIINEVIKDKKVPIQIQIYDLIKAFDKINLEFAMNDVYDTIEEDKRNDKLVVLYESNVKNTMKIKTPVGPTDIIEIEKVVQQGGTWGPIMCSNHVE